MGQGSTWLSGRSGLGPAHLALSLVSVRGVRSSPQPGGCGPAPNPVSVVHNQVEAGRNPGGGEAEGRFRKDIHHEGLVLW